ncbi:MAG: methionine--tRNA ligase subunit beta [Clostridiales bacterium]|nr:methionine--tRNA ligase subunit beta [Clostridiales bacterium]
MSELNETAAPVTPAVPEPAPAQEAPAQKPEIPFDVFEQVERPVVKVKECAHVKKSKKLLCFQLDDGTPEGRQILSGIAAWYEPEDLVGKTLVAVTNLAPRRMMGLESNGMLLSAESGDSFTLVMLDDGIPAGAKLC